ncbi:hypothetical protein QQP08_001120 [Theobroma cacao]|uniref:Uncharacterized protein n=1 Tax=Theobroma cacao TaxID=3641 RepID=A0A061DV60_THECC|nr:Uncharacterized protein TCM_005555 [Theobroma cacao]WRX08633.1 hypothetical protein QQP08_001120 [Theobroma cacao]
MGLEEDIDYLDSEWSVEDERNILLESERLIEKIGSPDARTSVWHLLILPAVGFCHVSGSAFGLLSCLHMNTSCCLQNSFEAYRRLYLKKQKNYYGVTTPGV